MPSHRDMRGGRGETSDSYRIKILIEVPSQKATKPHYYKTMTSKSSWKNQIPGSFGCVDRIFADHPEDEARAKDMINDAFASGASINDLLNAVKEYLKGKGCSPEHLQEQIDRLRGFSFNS